MTTIKKFFFDNGIKYFELLANHSGLFILHFLCLTITYLGFGYPADIYSPSSEWAGVTILSFLAINLSRFTNQELLIRVRKDSLELSSFYKDNMFFNFFRFWSFAASLVILVLLPYPFKLVGCVVFFLLTCLDSKYLVDYIKESSY